MWRQLVLGEVTAPYKARETGPRLTSDPGETRLGALPRSAEECKMIFGLGGLI